MDILLTEGHDVAFDNGDTPLITNEERLDVAQRLQIKLKTFLGEWFLNIDNGIPYNTQIFGKNRKKSTVDFIFQQQILEEEGVIEIVEFNSVFNNAQRQYSLTFRVRVASGVTDQITI